MEVNETFDPILEEPQKPARQPNPVLLSILLLVLGAVLPMMILYADNTGIRVIEVLLPVGILLVLALVLFAVFQLIFRRAVLSALLSAVIVLFIMNYHLFYALTSRLMKDPAAIWVALVLWVLILGGILFALMKLRKAEFLPQIAQIAAIVLGVLFLYNVIQVIPGWKRGAKLAAATPDLSPEGRPVLVSQEEMKSHTVEQNGRNFYWFLLDEMADAYTMEHYFDTDITPFLTYLKDKGFSVSSASYSNTNKSTYAAIDLATLNYFSDEYMTRIAALEEGVLLDGRLRARNGELYQTLLSMGYDLYQVSSHTKHYSMLTELQPQTLMEKMLVSTTVDGLSVLDVAEDMSVFSVASRLADHLGDDSISSRIFNESFRSRVLRVFRYYDDPNNLCFQNKTALFSYLLCPHTPFVFDENGDPVPAIARRDWTDPSHYANQHTYMTKRLTGAIESILSVDPNAIILIQSDHGVRGGFFVDKGVEVELDDQRRIFNALYFGGESVDIEGVSPVNTMRFILTQLGADYPPLNEEGLQHVYYKEQIAIDELEE